MHILPNISGSKSNQAMKLGQLTEYNKKIFFENHGENEARGQVPDLILFFKKALCGVKACSLQLID